MKGVWRKAAVAVGTAMLAASVLSGCNASKSVIEKPDKTITVIDKREKTGEELQTGEIEVSHIETLEGARGMDWLGEDRLIIDRENRNFEPQSVEGELRYVRNLYIKNMSGETPILEEKRNQGFAEVSPDGKYLFFKRYVEATSTGVIMNLETKEAAKLGDDIIPISEGRWTPEGRLIFPDMRGTIYLADPDGKLTRLFKAETYVLSHVVKQGSVVYYIMGDNSDLYAYDVETREEKKLVNGAFRIEPSPDGKHLALVLKADQSDTEKSLVVADPQGNTTKVVATGTEIYGTAWSPDGNSLAYNLVSEREGGLKGLFVADMTTGKTTQIAVDLQYATDKLRWSPSGKKLMSSTFVPGENGYTFRTYIISFK
jgi:Periplasmic component of the Tol biopolymer transport system